MKIVALLRNSRKTVAVLGAPPKDPSEFLSRLAARIRALCALGINRTGQFALTSCSVSEESVRPQRLLTVRSVWLKILP